jgi:cold shock CspA family protein
VDEATIQRWFEEDGGEDDDLAGDEPTLFGRGFSPYVYRDRDGFLCAGWGHRLTPPELEQWREGDLVDDETLDRWFQDDRLDREPDDEDAVYGDDGVARLVDDETFPLAPEALRTVDGAELAEADEAVVFVPDVRVEMGEEDENDPEMYFDPECPPGWHVGVVTGWHDDQGFGFIMPAVNPQDINNGKDLFVHQSEINKLWPEYYKTMVEGDMVEFKIERDDRGDVNAKDVRALGGGPVVNDPPLTADPLMVARTAQGESWLRMIADREAKMHGRAKLKRIAAAKREDAQEEQAQASLSFADLP